MSILISEDISKVIKNKNKLENILNVKIRIKGKEISVEGPAEDEYIAEKVIDAINLGFPLQIALLIKKEDFLFEILDLKDYTHRKDYEIIRARIIGKNGKTLKTLTTLTECNFELKDNNVGIIGSPECIKNGQNAIIMIIQGSKQANVYAYLEKHHVAPIFDLGLKEKTTKRKVKKKAKKSEKEF
jgi:KH domain-containing protein